ncbi:hypothetical protein Y032_0058g2864 [Ancylostoma ceylanicum]|uniref:Uncharacterized protein n=1 Tax=Ancylostoma ceylanicum TaxID=53326 RepID=A0A016U4U6_9BILA|nr:hypothetical protein Y032_0058g2864 [Ancylostoma ceylanicum]
MVCYLRECSWEGFNRNYDRITTGVGQAIGWFDLFFTSVVWFLPFVSLLFPIEVAHLPADTTTVVIADKVPWALPELTDYCAVKKICVKIQVSFLEYTVLLKKIDGLRVRFLLGPLT